MANLTGMGFRLKTFEMASHRLFNNSLGQHCLSNTITSRTLTNFRTVQSYKVFNVNCRHSIDGKVKSFYVKPVMPFRSFSSVCRGQPFKRIDYLSCGRSQQSVLNRWISKGSRQSEKENRKTTVIYICAVGVFMVGASYAGVPLYRIFCQATGLGGQAVKGHDNTKVEKMTPVKERVISVKFNADVASSMQWNFRPQQTEVKVLPGETALAFYTAKNPTDTPIIGISTYNVIPFEAGQYFNKIQCFCFEEQRLNPHEQVDMPVFFFIDPEFAEDPKCAAIETITLSYTFFEAKEGLELPYPGYAGSMYAKSAS